MAADLDVLVVGAGPTGLTLAAQLARFGVTFRIIDKQADRRNESRASGAARPRPTYSRNSRRRVFISCCGPLTGWHSRELDGQHASLLSVTRLTRDLVSDALVDDSGAALQQLGVDDAAQYVTRPDGHIGFRCAGTNLASAIACVKSIVTAPRPSDVTSAAHSRSS